MAVQKIFASTCRRGFCKQNLALVLTSSSEAVSVASAAIRIFEWMFSKRGQTIVGKTSSGKTFPGINNCEDMLEPITVVILLQPPADTWHSSADTSYSETSSMDIKLAFFLGLFLVVTVKSDIQKSDNPKGCQGRSHASGGTLDEMLGLVCQKNVSPRRGAHERFVLAGNWIPAKSKSVQWPIRQQMTNIYKSSPRTRDTIPNAHNKSLRACWHCRRN